MLVPMSEKTQSVLEPPLRCPPADPLSALLSTLQQLTVSAPGKPAASVPPTPADMSLDFAHAARERVNGALCRCEERYPLIGPYSVLCVVVERDAAQWQNVLEALHREHFGEGRVRLEVIDRAMDESLRRMIDAGLLINATSATRPLWPNCAGPIPLTDSERERAASHRKQAARKIRMAALLSGGGLAEEARAALLDAVEPLGCALAIENRLAEPASFEDALLPPLSVLWKEALPILRSFIQNPSQSVSPTVRVLERV